MSEDLLPPFCEKVKSGSKICSNIPNFNRMWFHFIKYAPKVLQGFIFCVKTVIGGAWDPMAKKGTEMFHYW